MRTLDLYGSEALPGKQTCQFARVIKGVDPISSAGNCAWVRTPQLIYFLLSENECVEKTKKQQPEELVISRVAW